MPTVVFESPDAGPLVVEAPTGGSLGDLCDDHSAPIPFSCRSATCGTCRCVILEGGEQLEPPEDEELDLLDVFATTPDKQRLACQAQMRPGLGRLRLRAVNEHE